MPKEKVSIVAHVIYPEVTFTLDGRIAPRYEGTLVLSMSCFDADGTEVAGGLYEQEPDGSFGPLPLSGVRASAWLFSSVFPYNYKFLLATHEDFWVA